jgi:hypothetical protein
MSDITGFEQSQEYLNLIISEAEEFSINPQKHLQNRQEYEKLYINMASLQGIKIDYEKLRTMKTVDLRRLISAVSPGQKRRFAKEFPN